jgi:hypothetical protein
VPIIVELSVLTDPVKVKVCVPATAVKVTFCPLIVPVIAAEPLLQFGADELEIEKEMLPLNELSF